VEARDPYTEGHCETPARDASDLGRELGLDERERRGIAPRRATCMTSQDRRARRNSEKGSNLTPAEWKIMKKHSVTVETFAAR